MAPSPRSTDERLARLARAGDELHLSCESGAIVCGVIDERHCLARERAARDFIVCELLNTMMQLWQQATK
jgi:hypothetical protein